MSDPLKLAKSVKPAVRVKLKRGGDLTPEQIKAQLEQKWTAPSTEEVKRALDEELSVRNALAKDPTRGLLSKTIYPTPADQMSVTKANPIKMMAQKQILPSDLQGSILMNAPGDRTDAGHYVTHLNGKELAFPVYMEGGRNFGLAKAGQDKKNPAGWASDLRVVSGMQNRAKVFQELYPNKKINMTYSAMHTHSGDSSHMMTDLMLAQIPSSKISKAAAKQFDKYIKQWKPDSGRDMSDFPGVLHPNVRDYLHKHSGAARSAFVKEMAKGRHTKAGFPDVASTRNGTLDARLANVPGNPTGSYVFQMNPNASPIIDPKHPHTTYNTQVPTLGYQGDMGNLSRFTVFPSQRANYFERGIRPASHDFTFEKEKVGQLADQQWVDNAMREHTLRKNMGLLSTGGTVWDHYHEAMTHAHALHRDDGGRAEPLRHMSEMLGQMKPIGSGYEGVEGKPAVVRLPRFGLVEARPIEGIERAADSYMRKIGRSGEHKIHAFKPFNEDFARQVAVAYDKMKHAPHDPHVKRAYDALIEETLGQYKAAVDQGYKFHFLRDGEQDPYAESPALGYADLVNNKRLTVFPTEQGFGSSNADTSKNPLLKKVGKIGDLPNATANDAFRAVHDLYGHFGPGNPFFRHSGEERAYQLHSKMFSPEARAALASETRGQNSWVNFGPHEAHNRTASGADTVYADQKTGIMPEWAHKADGGEVSDDGITAYHGSPHNFKRFDPNFIGTGEGNQAYGHGMYFAEAEPTALKYRNSLTNKVFHKGQQVIPTAHHDPVAAMVADGMLHGRTARESIDHLINSWTAQAAQHRKTAEEWPHNAEEHHNRAAKAEALARAYSSVDPDEFEKQVGHMYQVRLRARPEHFLDWDRPISQQSEHVGNAIKSMMNLTSHERDNMPIRSFYEMLGGPRDASAKLHAAGVRGIRYLDAGSRTATQDPTSNFVVFHPDDVEITRKYARGGMIHLMDCTQRQARADGGRLRGKIVNGRHGYSVDGGVPEAGSTGSAAGNSYGGSDNSGSSSSDTSNGAGGSGNGNNGNTGFGATGGFGGAGEMSSFGKADSNNSDALGIGSIGGTGTGFAGSNSGFNENGIASGGGGASDTGAANPNGGWSSRDTVHDPFGGSHVGAGGIGSDVVATANSFAQMPRFADYTPAQIMTGMDRSGYTTGELAGQAGMPNAQYTNMTDPSQIAHAGIMQQNAQDAARQAYINSQAEISPTDSLNSYNWQKPVNSAAAQAGFDAGMNAGIQPSQVGVGSADVYQMGQDMRPQAPLPDSAFGHTMVDPTGRYTDQALQNMNTATDAVTMLNDPSLAGSFVRAFAPTPTPATPQQQTQINNMYAGAYGDNSTPPGFATLPSTPSLPHPGQTSDAYLGAGPSASIGRQDYGTSAPSAVGSGSPVDAYGSGNQSSARSDFNQAFANARSSGQDTFSWTNPVTGRTQTYNTRLAQNSGGRAGYDVGGGVETHVNNNPQSFDPKTLWKTFREDALTADKPPVQPQQQPVDAVNRSTQNGSGPQGSTNNQLHSVEDWQHPYQTMSTGGGATHPEPDHAMVQKYLSDPEWSQVEHGSNGMFVDPRTNRPVAHADEVLQVGPLLMARNAKFGKTKSKPQSLLASSIVGHALNKIGAPLPASMTPHQGNATGRRR